eukprot:6202911-Pyramimonas_sp.AAC.1
MEPSARTLERYQHRGGAQRADMQCAFVHLSAIADASKAGANLSGGPMIDLTHLGVLVNVSGRSRQEISARVRQGRLCDVMVPGVASAARSLLTSQAEYGQDWERRLLHR